MRAEATEAGYTREVQAEGGCFSLSLLVKTDADLDGTFRAFEVDTQEWLNVNGWNFTIEDLACTQHRDTGRGVCCDCGVAL